MIIFLPVNVIYRNELLWMKEKTYLKHVFKIINFNYNLNDDQESVVTI